VTGPLVSIVIPVYNGADYLREAIDSALRQTYAPCEIVVVNDGSRDGGATDAIARSYGNAIRYVPKENGGVASALNAGIAAMSGAYFSWLSHDDVYHPDKVAAQMSLLRAGDPPVVLYSNYELIDPAGRKLGVRRIRPGRLPFRASLVAEDPVNGCTVLVPRACFDEVGMFDLRLRTAQDYDMWFRLARRYRFIHVPEALIGSRIHPAQGTRTIGTFFEESSRQFVRMLRELEPSDLRDHEAPSSVFTRVALKMKLRGYDEVARAALELSRRHSSQDGLAERTHRAAATLACAVLTKKVKPSYWAERLREARRGSRA
jgi:glycosyltransferase involved in cell wall biosynthesis